MASPLEIYLAKKGSKLKDVAPDIPKEKSGKVVKQNEACEADETSKAASTKKKKKPAYLD